MSIPTGTTNTTFAGDVTHGSAAYVTLTDYGTSANSRIITGGTNTATGYLAVAQWNGSAYVNTVSFSGSDNATTFAGEVNVGTTASGDGTLNIIASTGEQSIIEFSDTTNSRGRIYYDHASSPEKLILETTGTTAMSIDNSQDATFAGDVVAQKGTLQDGAYTGGLILGANANSTASTNSVAKIGRISSPHYTSAEENIFVIGASSDGTINDIFYGGSAGVLNAATNHKFYTASTDTTTTGTLALTLDTSQNATFAGDVSVGDAIKVRGLTDLGTAGTIGTKQVGADAYAFLAEASANDRWLRMGHNGTSAQIDSTYRSTGGNSPLQFLTSGVVRQTIATDGTATFAGNIVSGSTGGSSAGNITVSFNGAADNGIYIRNTNTGASANVLMAFDRNGSTTGSITHTNSSTSYVTSSDYRLKENVVTDWDATTRLKQLKPSRFNFIVDADKTVDGFLAHEAQAVVPECATGLKDAMKDEEYEVSAATGEVFTPAIEEVTTETQVMETVETGSYVNLAGETIVETSEQGVTTETTETVVQRQDIDGVSTEVEVEVTTQVPTMETVITTAAVAETVHSTDVVQPETLADGQQWRETTAQVMATRSVPDYQGIDQSKLVPLLVKTIQELEARITTLEA
jgi:hypothetical protein